MNEIGRENSNRDDYESGELYAPSRICLKPTTNPRSYTDRLLADRLSLVRRYYRGGLALDLCCAAGAHLLELAPVFDEGLGLDFSHRYIATAQTQAKAREATNLTFLHGDAKAIPLRDRSIDLVYSFSSLYAIPGVAEVVSEISRVLTHGGHAVLDFGNKRSLNTYCLKYYTDWPSTFPITVSEMRAVLQANDLKVEEHKSYQLLPLWAGLPKHLWPLLHPWWRETLRLRLGGRMLDEWISSLPYIRRFAFRHLIVCRKI